MYQNRKLRDQTIDGENLLIDSVTFLGPSLKLSNCNLTFTTSAGNITIIDSVFLDCFIEVKRKFSNFQDWCNADIQRCIFKGQFSGNDFGRWQGQSSNNIFVAGSIGHCDFSRASMEASRLMSCDMATIKLPSWPCVTTVKEDFSAQNIDSINWPGALKRWALSRSDVDEPKETTATIDSSPYLCKNFDVTEEELLSTLAKLKGVLL